MQKEKARNHYAKFKYRGKTYIPLRKMHIRSRLFLIVEEWSTRYKAFDVSAQEWRSIRVRGSGVKYEMHLMQFAKLRNNNVPYVFDHYKDSSSEYLIQEWVDGHDLRSYLRRKPGGKPYFEARRSYYLVKGLVTGLNRLHERSVFHGDIKPDNLIVAGANRLVMIDFGAAWSGARTRSRPDEKTRGYAPPEQWLREKLVDHRADQFATSAVLYEMLTGELPYDGRGGFGFDYTNHPQLVPPSKKNKAVWESLDHVIMKGLSLDKNQRYETSAAWLRDFNAAAPPDSTTQAPLSSYFPGVDLWQSIKTAVVDKYFHFE